MRVIEILLLYFKKFSWEILIIVTVYNTKALGLTIFENCNYFEKEYWDIKIKKI